MFGVNLIVTITPDDFCGTLGCLLCSLGKSLKLHHDKLSSYQLLVLIKWVLLEISLFL